MKKSDFQKTVRDMVLESYPRTNTPIKEYDPAVPESPEPSYGGNSDSETPFLRGYEPMSEQIKEIYRQFKGIIKENISEVDFDKKIRGVFYEYAQGAAEVTPTTSDPVRDPEAVEQEGDKVKEVGQAIADLGKKAKEIKNRPVQTSIKEYVDSQILPTVIEIMKQAENPRATKRELLEFFKLTSK